MTFTEFMDRAAQAFEVFAVAVLVVGMVWALLYSARVWRTSGDARRGYALLREFLRWRVAEPRAAPRQVQGPRR
jgi:hypothetical protein